MKYTVRGQVVDSDALPLYMDKAKPKPPAEPIKKHGGFAVEGYEPGRIEAAHKAADAAMVRWNRGERAENARAPQPWDQNRWMLAHKRTRIETPFSTPAIAAECKAMAERDGWELVEVRELITGEG